MNANEKFADLVREHLSLALVEHGFAKRRETFRRQRNDAWQVIEFDRGKWSTSSRVEFSIDLGVTLDRCVTPDDPWRERGWPAAYESQFQHVLLDNKSKPFRVGRSTRVAALSGDVLHLVETIGLPWLDLFSDPSRLLEVVEARPEVLDECQNPFPVVALARTIGSVTQVAAAERALEESVARAHVLEARRSM